MMKLIKKISTYFRLNYFKKIFLYSILIILITVLISYLLNLFFLNDFYVSRKKSAIKKAVYKISTIYDSQQELDDYSEFLKENYGIEFKILEKKDCSNRSMSSMVKKNHSIPRFISLQNEDFKITKSDNLGIKFLSYSKEIPNDKKLIFWTSLSVMDSHQHEFNLFNILATLISITFTLIFALFFSKRLTKDITKLTITAEEISNLKFPKNIVIHRDDEIGQLSISLNNMSQNLEKSINNLKSFVSNASHELKTPISILSSYAQALVSQSANSPEQLKSYHNTILKTTAEMQYLVEKLLTLSKLTSLNYTITKESVSIPSLIDESIEKYEFLELQNDITILKNISKTITNCDLYLMKIAIDNIIQNALKYSLPDSELKITYINGVFSFINTCNISNTNANNIQNTSELFEPFFRGSNHETHIDGTGLGLSIVKQIFELHHFEFGVNIQDNQFTLWFKP